MSNFFELLGLQPAFDMDLPALEQAYFKAQQQFHPDRFVGKLPEERTQAAQQSADINQAYQTLKNPLKRAQYLLKQQAVFVGGEQDTVKPTAELLMETMGWRETLEEADSLDKVRELENLLNQAHQSSLNAISVAYQVQDWQNMAHQSLRLGYVIKTRDEVAKQLKNLSKKTA
ncbi:MAG: Fe-S protein assembly co-chaperone HscB [Rickettsiales bacterium]|nr:Fe-S protein assembly co-chaperone HscB [Rickettsiales bacterium]